MTITRFDLYLFTKDPGLASAASDSGVTYVGPDIETVGKAARQNGFSTRLSDHSIEDLPRVYQKVSPDRRFVRSNPIHGGSREEFDRLIEAGASAIMLPYFRTIEEVRLFTSVVGERARKILLVETVDAAERLENLVRIPGVDQIHVGLNDLRLDAGMPNHFELLCSSWMANRCSVLAASGKPFGFGGIGRAMDTNLPVPSDLIYAQYARLGARAAIISRAFTQNLHVEHIPAEVARARQRLSYWFGKPEAVLEQKRVELQCLTRDLYLDRAIA